MIFAGFDAWLLQFLSFIIIMLVNTVGLMKFVLESPGIFQIAIKYVTYLDRGLLHRTQ